MKKRILGAYLISIATIVPIVMVIYACIKSTNDKKIPILQTRHMAAKEEYNYTKSSLSDNSKIKLKELRDLRIIEGNGWEPTGDSVINSINDIRFVVFKEANNDSKPREILKEFIMSVFEWSKDLKSIENIPVPTTVPFAPIVEIDEPGRKAFEDYKKYRGKISFRLAIESMNNFLNKGDLSTITGLGAGMDGFLDDKVHSRIMSYSDEDSLKDTKPLIGTERLMGWAQYRAQQIEWNGVWDNHHHQITTKATHPENIDKSVHSLKPHPWSLGADENIGQVLPINNAYKDNKLSSINTWEAWTSAWEFFLDNHDASQTLGHRANIIAPNKETIGWSMSIDNISINPYDNQLMYQQTMFYELGRSIVPKDTDNFLWINFNDYSYAGWLARELDQNTLPLNWNVISKEKKIYLLSSDKTILLKDGTPFANYNLKISVKQQTPIEEVYSNLIDSVIKTNIYRGIGQQTYLYNYLTTGLQALYEDSNNEEWKKN